MHFMNGTVLGGSMENNTRMKKISLSIILLVLIISFCSACHQKHAMAETTPVAAPTEAAVAEVLAIPVIDTFLVYNRGACFGMCPIFNLVIYTDGKAVYEGKNFVDRIGFYQATVDAAALQKITSTAESIGYFGLDAIYDDNGVTDLPSTLTGIRKDGKLKMVTNRYRGPKSLKTLYDELDALIAKQQWKAQ